MQFSGIHRFTLTLPATAALERITTVNGSVSVDGARGAAQVESVNGNIHAANLGGGDPVAGKAVFLSAGCSGCHTLSAAGATGTVGPNLDEKKPPLSLVLLRVTQGKGAMPSFKGQLTPQQIKDVAAFVASAS